MSATFHLDIKPWADAVTRLDKRMANKTFPELLKQQGKLLVRDLILATPPFDRATINGPLAAQRRVGLAAVAGDVRRLFNPLPNVMQLTQGDKRMAATILGYRKRGELDKLRTLLNRLGVACAAVVYEATAGIHAKNRTVMGRIPKKINPTIVIRGNTIGALVRKLQGDVGKLKAGWLAGARKLGVSVPNWIAKHSTPGTVQDQSKNLSFPSITVSNDSAFGSKVQHRIVEFAIEKRRGSMAKQLAELVAAELAKAKASP